MAAKSPLLESLVYEPLETGILNGVNTRQAKSVTISQNNGSFSWPYYICILFVWTFQVLTNKMFCVTMTVVKVNN